MDNGNDVITSDTREVEENTEAEGEVGDKRPAVT